MKSTYLISFPDTERLKTLNFSSTESHKNFFCYVTKVTFRKPLDQLRMGLVARGTKCD